MFDRYRPPITSSYHDNDMCGFDLWAPQHERCMVHERPVDPPKINTHGQWLMCPDADDSYFSDLSHQDLYCAVENRAFSPFAKHEQEKEDAVNLILSGATQIQFDDEMSQEDLRWIEQEVHRRSGATCSLT